MTPKPSKRTHAFAALALVAGAAWTTPARADDPWEGGKQWLSVRAGYAKSYVEGSGRGGGGYGFGYSRQLKPWKLYKWTYFKHFSFGAYVHHELLGRFGDASEIEVPVTVELVRHFKWDTVLRPYLGIGGGPFFRKTNRTGEDLGKTETGYYLTFGANAPVAERHMIGMDARLISVGARNEPPNSVFGPGQERGAHWSLKLNFAVVY